MLGAELTTEAKVFHYVYRFVAVGGRLAAAVVA